MSQGHMFETQVARAMLDQLLDDSRLYKKGGDYKSLLEFVVKLRNFAPFNAMLLQLQKPGLQHAASAHEWSERFGRTVKPHARPLLILWPFGPVALVYDVMDTEGDPLPAGISAFQASGGIDQARLEYFAKLLGKKHIEWHKFDGGDGNAGSIERLTHATVSDERSRYRMSVNRNHDPNVQFATLAHELAHLYLGHLGRDKWLGIPDRPRQSHKQRELEAESAAFIVCARNGVASRSEIYLTNYVQQDTTTQQLDLYQIMRATGQIESVLGLGTQTKYARSKSATKSTQSSLFSDDALFG